jgi:hypothetical protein
MKYFQYLSALFRLIEHKRYPTYFSQIFVQLLGRTSVFYKIANRLFSVVKKIFSKKWGIVGIVVNLQSIRKICVYYHVRGNIKMTRQILYFIFILTTFVSCKNDPYKNLDKRLLLKVQEISQLRRYQIGPYEFGELDKKNFKHPYFYLRDSSKIDDLRLLTNYPNTLVRIYSFRVLAEKKDTSIFSIIINHLSDTSKVQVWDHDYGWSSSVADQMIRLGLRRLDSISRDSIRDLVFLKHNYLNSTAAILYNLKPIEKYYQTTKKLVQQNFDESAYIALASYQRKSDIPLIKKGFKDFNIYRGEIFKAIELFPDTAFLPLLFDYYRTRVKENMDAMDDFKYFYKALAKFQRPDCLKILDDMKQRKYYSSEGYWNSNQVNIFEALHKYKCPLYNNLYQELEKQMPEYIFKYLDLPDYRDNSQWW